MAVTCVLICRICLTAVNVAFFNCANKILLSNTGLIAVFMFYFEQGFLSPQLELAGQPPHFMPFRLLE